MLMPPTYLSEGKILVELQQIPVDLVRPTVTATASERIATIQQRVMTRENLLKIADKYDMYADQREQAIPHGPPRSHASEYHCQARRH